jgi:hypothetical protein
MNDYQSPFRPFDPLDLPQPERQPLRLTRIGAFIAGILTGGVFATVIITYTLFASQWGAR